jgi:hypothetical protein
MVVLYTNFALLGIHLFGGRSDVRKEFGASYKRVVAVVEGIPEEEIFAVGRYAWLGENNLVGVILANTANHYRWAKGQIREWLKSQGEL